MRMPTYEEMCPYIIRVWLYKHIERLEAKGVVTDAYKKMLILSDDCQVQWIHDAIFVIYGATGHEVTLEMSMCAVLDAIMDDFESINEITGLSILNCQELEDYITSQLEDDN